MVTIPTRPTVPRQARSGRSRPVASVGPPLSYLCGKLSTMNEAVQISISSRAVVVFRRQPAPSRLPSLSNREACAGKPSNRRTELWRDSPRPRRARIVMHEKTTAQINETKETTRCNRVRTGALTYLRRKCEMQRQATKPSASHVREPHNLAVSRMRSNAPSHV